MSEWQDISTAPKDGTRVWAWDGRDYGVAYKICVTDWNWGLECPNFDPDYDTWEPTHWMPLPTPPAKPTGE